MITVRRQLAKHCPYADEIDVGTLTITAPTDAPELHALTAQIDKIAAGRISHEEFTRHAAALLPPGSVVTWVTRTGPWDVECREGGSGDLLREPVDP
jgi:hypothetical protein